MDVEKLIKDPIGALLGEESGGSSGGGGVDKVEFYQCSDVDTENKTWSGNKAVWSDADGYIFEETATDGLEYGTGFAPAVGGVYNSDATINIAKLFEKTKPITYNDTSCLIYIDGTSVSNQALAPNKHEVTFGSGVTASDGYLQIPNTEDGRCATTSKYDGFGGTLKQWTWDYYFIADGTYLSISGRSNEYWCIECHGGEGTYLYFRGQNTSTKRLPLTYRKNKLIGLSMQWDDGVLHVWNKGTYIGQCVPTFSASEGVVLGINTDMGGGNVNYMARKIKLFRFSNKARYTPGVNFELPEGFLEGAAIPEENMIFYAPLSSQASTAATGQNMSYSNCVFTTHDGINCMRCNDGNSAATVNIPTIPQGSAARTISFWGCADSYTSDWMGFFSYGTDAPNQLVCVRTNSDLASIGFSYNDHDSTIYVAGSWHHFTMTYDGSVAKLYVDGITALDVTTALDTVGTELKIGAGVNERTGYRGYIAALRVYDRALSADEITALANEF